jgi:hypothetical protein
MHVSFEFRFTIPSPITYMYTSMLNVNLPAIQIGFIRYSPLAMPAGYVAPTSLVWRSGRSKWQPLQDIPELAVALRTVDASSTAATASAVAAADGADLGGRDSGNAVQTTADVLQMSLVKPAGAKPAGSRGGGSAPVLTAAAQQHDPMAAFLGEISAIEAVGHCQHW